MEPALTDTKGAAEFLAVPEATLISWRSRGGGPPYIKFGSSRQATVRYSFADLRKWLEARTTETLLPENPIVAAKP